MANERNTFSSSLGFVLAAAGSAVGLGNIWRFPYLAARDGGGLFLLIYVLLALSFGFTLLITEIAIGRSTQQGPLTAYGVLSRKWTFLGLFSFIIPCIIYPYYCVIGGWVLKYVWTYLSMCGNEAVDEGYFSSFITAEWLPIFFTIAFAAICFHVVYAGVEKGIERYSRILMPILLVLVIFICICSLCMSHTDDNGITRTGWQGAVFYFVPNFEGLTFDRFLQIALDATGQLFYSLSIAMGIMVTYGSYMKKNVNLGKAVDNIEIFDSVIAILAGLMIIPAVYAFSGTEGMSAGPGLMFITLPKVFDALGDFGYVVGIIFFIMVLFAAITSAVSILEACVSAVMDKFHWSRHKSVFILGLYGLFFSIIVCLGYNHLYCEIKLPNGAIGQILDIFDYVSNNLLMPICAILTCILIGWVIKPRLLIEEMKLNGYTFRRQKLYIYMLRFIVPVLLATLLLASI